MIFGTLRFGLEGLITPGFCFVCCCLWGRLVLVASSSSSVVILGRVLVVLGSCGLCFSSGSFSSRLSSLVSSVGVVRRGRRVEPVVVTDLVGCE